jgi:hypothetical protein
MNEIIIEDAFVDKDKDKDMEEDKAEVEVEDNIVPESSVVADMD